MRIIIVGGGTAGWLAALFISHIKPEHEVTVIESTSIGIIGAGEGSTGLLTNVINNSLWDFGCDHMDFLKTTGATLKYGIKHKDWANIGTSYYGPLDGSLSFRSIPDVALAYQAANHNINQMHTASELGLMLENNLSNVNKTTLEFTNYYHALHFDAHEVGKYFKNHILSNRQVKHIDSEVEEVTLHESGLIKSLKLKNSKQIFGDFFIDATGFKRVLSTAIGVDWVSYKKHLPVDSAMPFLLDYESNEYPEPYTTAWAQSSGWMWQIPNQKQKGCGYVFDSNFITADQAHAEIEKTLGKKINPIRILKFDTGRLSKLWTKNCLSIGLSAAFAEPLEATSIHSTIVQLTKFTFEHLKHSLEDTLNYGSVELYNAKMIKMYDDFKDFLVTHYMGGRSDSSFWKYISSGETKTDFVDLILEMSKSKMPTFNDFNEYHGAAGWPLYAWVLLGTGNLTPDVCKKDLQISTPKFTFDQVLKTEFDEWKSNTLLTLSNNMSYKEFIDILRVSSNTGVNII